MLTDMIITRFISENLMSGRAQSPPKPDESLIKAGILDSAAVLKLLVFVEEQFEMTIDDLEVTPDNFESVDRITAFIESKQGKRGGRQTSSG